MPDLPHELEGFVTALTRHQTRLRGLVRCLLFDPAQTEDVLQDTFIRLVTEAQAGRMPDNVRAWLYRVAANAAISRSRVPRGTCCLSYASLRGVGVNWDSNAVLICPNAATMARPPAS